jgi:hypothetical protein
MTTDLHLKSVFNKLLGALIIYRTIAPIIMIIMLVSILYYIPSEINRISSKTVNKIEDEQLAPLKDSLKDMRQEVNRLKGEVEKAKNAVEGVNTELKKALSPMVSAINALYVALRELRYMTQTVVNAIINAVNVLPAINIKKPDFPEIRIDLPKLDLTPLKINLKPDLRSLEQMKRISKEVGTELNQSLKETGETFSIGWQWIKVIIILFAIWVVALLITIFDGMRRNVYRGWKMILGNEAKEFTD